MRGGGPHREAPGSFRRQKELGESRARTTAFFVIFEERTSQHRQAEQV